MTIRTSAPTGRRRLALAAFTGASALLVSGLAVTAAQAATAPTVDLLVEPATTAPAPAVVGDPFNATLTITEAGGAPVTVTNISIRSIAAGTMTLTPGAYLANNGVDCPAGTTANVAANGTVSLSNSSFGAGQSCVIIIPAIATAPAPNGGHLEATVNVADAGPPAGTTVSSNDYFIRAANPVPQPPVEPQPPVNPPVNPPAPAACGPDSPNTGNNNRGYGNSGNNNRGNCNSGNNNRGDNNEGNNNRP